MKKYIIVSVILSFNYVLVSAQSTTLTNTELYNPKNLSTKQNYRIDSEVKNQIFMFEYLYKAEINTISTTYDHIEPLYTAKLFYNQINKVTINHISQYDDGSKFEIPHQYIYDNSGNIQEILCLEDSKYKIEFYYQNGLLTNVKNYHTSIPMTVTEGHKVTHTQSEVKVDDIIFKYSNGLLVQQDFLTNQQRNIFQGARSYYYYQDNNNFALTYIKYIDKSFMNEQRLICIESNRIKYITFSYGSPNSETTKTEQIFLFSYSGNLINIFQYEPNRNKSGVMTLNSVIELQVGEKSSIENIKVNYRSASNPHIKEIYFRYHYAQSRLIGYDIFERTLYKNEKPENKDYELDKAYYLIANNY